jgi:hypothetical protein
MVNYRLVHELQKEKKLPAEQYGFRKGRSTEDVHVIFKAEVQEGFREKQHLILVSFDLEKTYHTCWRHHIPSTSGDSADICCKWLQNLPGKNQCHAYMPYTIETGEPVVNTQRILETTHRNG